MKTFELNGYEVEFWNEGPWLFCRLGEMGADIYCCGDRQMPKTDDEAMKLTEIAWIW